MHSEDMIALAGIISHFLQQLTSELAKHHRQNGLYSSKSLNIQAPEALKSLFLFYILVAIIDSIEDPKPLVTLPSKAQETKRPQTVVHGHNDHITAVCLRVCVR